MCVHAYVYIFCFRRVINSLIYFKLTRIREKCEEIVEKHLLNTHGIELPKLQDRMYLDLKEKLIKQMEDSVNSEGKGKVRNGFFVCI